MIEKLQDAYAAVVAAFTSDLLAGKTLAVEASEDYYGEIWKFRVEGNEVVFTVSAGDDRDFGVNDYQVEKVFTIHDIHGNVSRGLCAPVLLAAIEAAHEVNRRLLQAAYQKEESK